MVFIVKCSIFLFQIHLDDDAPHLLVLNHVNDHVLEQVSALSPFELGETNYK